MYIIVRALLLCSEKNEETGSKLGKNINSIAVQLIASKYSCCWNFLKSVVGGCTYTPEKTPKHNRQN